MTCKHENAVGYMWRDESPRPDRKKVWHWAFTQPGYPEHHDRVTCQDCGEWLSLGAASDGGEHAAALAIEKHAAELAVKWGPVSGENIYVKDGWYTHRDGWAPNVDNSDAQAGYLARCIVTHEEEV